MIDGAHPGANRGLDPGRAVRMGRDLPAPAGRLDHRSFDFFIGILLPAGLDPFRENRARRHDLDEVRAIFEIGPDRFRDFFRTVREIFDQRRIEIDGKLFRVARAAGGGNVIPGHEQTRPRHRAFIDGIAQIDIDVRPGRPHLAAGGEPGPQSHERVARAPECIVTGRRFSQRILPVHAHPDRQMRVQIDQSGQQSRVTQIDHFRARRNAEIRANLSNLFAFHPHHCRNERRADRVHQSDDPL